MIHSELAFIGKEGIHKTLFIHKLNVGGGIVDLESRFQDSWKNPKPLMELKVKPEKT